jgi:hypothetical protein
MALFGRPSAENQRRAEAYGDWIGRRNPLAITSFVLGVFSLVEFGALLVFGVAGIVLGVMALRQLRRTSTSAEGEKANIPLQAVDPAGVLTYADRSTPPAIDASRYEPSDRSLPKTHGHGLAWAGIALSVISLIAATVLYSFRWHRG